MSTDDHNPDTRKQRKYHPTLAELVDRLTIVQLKQIFISEHAAEYRAEIALIEHDIDVALSEIKTANATFALGGAEIRAIVMIMLANRVVWENEAAIRAGVENLAQDEVLKRLRLTHSINGARNVAKNRLSSLVGGQRIDHKTDCLAADLIPLYGNWNVFK